MKNFDPWDLSRAVRESRAVPPPTAPGWMNLCFGMAMYHETQPPPAFEGEADTATAELQEQTAVGYLERVLGRMRHAAAFDDSIITGILDDLPSLLFSDEIVDADGWDTDDSFAPAESLSGAGGGSSGGSEDGGSGGLDLQLIFRTRSAIMLLGLTEALLRGDRLSSTDGGLNLIREAVAGESLTSVESWERWLYEVAEESDRDIPLVDMQEGVVANDESAVRAIASLLHDESGELTLQLSHDGRFVPVSNVGAVPTPQLEGVDVPAGGAGGGSGGAGGAGAGGAGAGGAGASAHRELPAGASDIGGFAGGVSGGSDGEAGRGRGHGRSSPAPGTAHGDRQRCKCNASCCHAVLESEVCPSFQRPWWAHGLLCVPCYRSVSATTCKGCSTQAMCPFRIASRYVHPLLPCPAHAVVVTLQRAAV